MKYFSIDEFDCKHTGKNEMNHDFLELLDELRERCDFPFYVTSGYRDKTHPIEMVKKNPGVHTEGIAADIAISSGYQRRKIVEEAIKMGFNGIGIANSFIHVDSRAGKPIMWTYQ